MARPGARQGAAARRRPTFSPPRPRPRPSPPGSDPPDDISLGNDPLQDPRIEPDGQDNGFGGAGGAGGPAPPASPIAALPPGGGGPPPDDDPDPDDGWSSDDDYDASLPQRSPMEDQFSSAAIDAVFTGYPSIRGYNLPADVGTRGAYSLYPRLYSIRNEREFASAFPKISNTHREVTALYTTYAWLGVINNGFKDL